MYIMGLVGEEVNHATARNHALPAGDDCHWGSLRQRSNLCTVCTDRLCREVCTMWQPTRGKVLPIKILWIWLVHNYYVLIFLNRTQAAFDPNSLYATELVIDRNLRLIASWVLCNGALVTSIPTCLCGLPHAGNSTTSSTTGSHQIPGPPWGPSGPVDTSPGPYPGTHPGSAASRWYTCGTTTARVAATVAATPATCQAAIQGGPVTR